MRRLMARRSWISLVAGAAAVAGLATSSTHAHAASQIALPVPACGVAAWGVTGSGGGSVARPPQAAWDGGSNGPTARDAPLVPTRERSEPPPNPADGTPLVIFGGAATLVGGVWTTVTLAEGGEMQGLYGAVPVTTLGLVLVGFGLAKWAGPNQWETPSEAARGERPLVVTSRGIGAAF